MSAALITQQTHSSALKVTHYSQKKGLHRHLQSGFDCFYFGQSPAIRCDQWGSVHSCMHYIIMFSTDIVNEYIFEGFTDNMRNEKEKYRKQSRCYPSLTKNFNRVTN